MGFLIASDRGFDEASCRVRNLIDAKIGSDTAYQLFQQEAATRPEVSSRTAQRVRLALEAAIEDDPRYDNRHISFHQQPAPPPVPLADRMRADPECATAVLQTMDVDRAARMLAEIAWHTDGRRPAGIVAAGLPTNFAARLFDRIEAPEAAKILAECRTPGRKAAILLAMTRTRAFEVMTDTSAHSGCQEAIVRDLEPATAIAFLEEVGLTTPVTHILTRLEPAAVVQIVRTLPPQRQREIREHFAYRKQYDPHAKRIHAELRRAR